MLHRPPPPTHAHANNGYVTANISKTDAKYKKYTTNLNALKLITGLKQNIYSHVSDTDQGESLVYIL